MKTSEALSVVIDMVADLTERTIAAEESVAPLKAENEALRERIAALEARPAPEVVKGDPGEPGKDGESGANGKDGADGCGVKDLLIDREGNLIATMDDGRTKNLGEIIGKDGEPGKDGRDGFDLTSFDAQVLEDDRTIEFKFVSGDYERIATLKWPTMIYRGVYSEGQQYDAGDTVSWGGSAWIAERATNEKPDTSQSGWKLAVKKGMRGADAPSIVAARNG